MIDGDLCEQFNSMEPNKQKNVSEELDRTPPEVSKKLEDIRTRYAFWALPFPVGLIRDFISLTMGLWQKKGGDN